ncbi:MAG: DEAD/DEAH box helicase, partial [Saccharospirillum sp.]
AHGRTRNLLVAATGTGKTVMAAFDYRRIAREQGGQPRLLFVAHREEILKQAQHTYRQVLHDPNFGDLLTGHHDPEQHNHLFATIQSLQSRALLAQLGADYWQVVVIDECHHIEAKGFEQFVTTVEPAVLLGLTATPERHDGKNILRHFHNRPDGTPAAQLRLWHALDLQLLAPFEYYGCDDGEDYRTISWGQPQLEQQQLSNLLTGNQMRARTIINNWRNLVADTRQCKALAFCVSVEHAEFMTAQFNQAGINARLVTGKTNRDDRNAAPRQLQNGEINVIVTVDLYNEGIDLPFVDTLLLLRPTQSATVFQQQIGRGLRLYEGKESCLVLDFVGQYQDGFRFDTLYSSITGLSRREIADSVEHGFARLPSGCHLQLHKTAREHILRSLKQAINQNWRRLQTELARYAALKGSNQVSLSAFLTDHDLELEDIYRSHSTNTNSGWTNLQRAAGLITGNGSTEETYFSKRFAALLHQDDPAQWELLAQVAEDPAYYRITSDQDRLRLQMLAYQIDSNTKSTGTAESFLKRLANEPHTCQELKALAEVQQTRHYHRFKPLPGLERTPLRLHAAYQLREILTAVGRWTEDSRPEFREGVLRLHDQKTELIFITLDK